MPNLTPLLTHRPDNQPLFLLANSDVPGKQSDVAYGLTWSVLLTTPVNVLSAIIPVPGLQADTPLSCTVQLKAVGTQNIVDSVNCWISGCYASTDQIFIYLSASAAPVDNANFGISWAVVGDPTP